MSVQLDQFKIIINNSVTVFLMNNVCQNVNTYGKMNFCFASTAAAVRIGYEEHMPGQVSVLQGPTCSLFFSALIFS